jgi:hypothetical protein
MAPQESPTPRGPAHRKDEPTVDTSKSSAPAHPPTDDHDQDERPHACHDGWVTIGQTVIDPETGEETEEFALYLCRRCSDSR